MMNKVIYETASKQQVDPWNERPRDVANLSKWMGKQSLEGYLNWQIVNLNVPVADLHDAPIMYISGSEDLALSNQDIDKLRLFVEQGGMILGNADCGASAAAFAFTLSSECKAMECHTASGLTFEAPAASASAFTMAVKGCTTATEPAHRSGS